MNEIEQLTTALQMEADFYGVVVQVVDTPDQIYVYLNRPPELPPDCPELVQLIKDKTQDALPHIASVVVASRILGEETPDWQAEFALQESPLNFLPEEPMLSVPMDFLEQEPVIDSQPEIKEAQEVKLNSFCFSRNRQLVEGDVDKPSQEVREKIKAFHNWEREKQIQLLQFLKEWFANPDQEPSIRELNKLSGDGQDLVRAMHSNKELLRSLKVWLSRYCYDPAKTMGEITGESYSQPHRVKTPSHSKPKGDTPPPSRSAKTGHTPSPKQVNNKIARSPSPTKSSTQAQSSQSFSVDEVPMILITAVLAGVCAWLLSGAVSAFGWLGILLAVVSIVAGFMGVLQEKLIGGICGLIMVSFWFILGFLTVWWFEILGGAIGGITAVGMQMAGGKGGNLFSPKSLRILFAVLAVVLVIQGSSIWQWSGGGLRITTGAVLADHKASGTVMFQGKSSQLKGSIAILEKNKSDETNYALTVAALPTVVTSSDIDRIRKAESPLDEILDIIGDIAEPNISFAILVIIFDQKQPKGYLLNIFNQQNSGSGYSRRGLNKIAPPSDGLKLTQLNLQPNGNIKLSLNTTIDSQASANFTVDTKLIVR